MSYFYVMDGQHLLAISKSFYDLAELYGPYNVRWSETWPAGSTSQHASAPIQRTQPCKLRKQRARPDLLTCCHWRN